LLRYFPLLFVAFARSFGYILTYAPSLAYSAPRLKKNLLQKCFDLLCFLMLVLRTCIFFALLLEAFLHLY